MDDPPTITPPSDQLPAGDAFEVHRQMVIALFIATSILCIVLAIGLICSAASMLMVVIAAGALGGFVSALRRLYAFQRFFPVSFFSNRQRVSLYLMFYSMIPSLVGAIAAVTLYLVFASELVAGTMFPKFHFSSLNPLPDDFKNFVWNWQPVQATDYAKALVWSFIAGFSERFVPDLLDRFAKNAQDQENKKELDKKSSPPKVV